VRARCADCGARGHEAVPDHANCSRAFRAARAVAKLRLSMREAADMFGVTVGSVSEELRRDPEAWRVALARAAEVREERRAAWAPPLLVGLAVRAVHDDDLMTKTAARAYGVPAHAVSRASRRLHPGVDRRRRRW